MRLPNKAISYEESILPKIPVLLEEIDKWYEISPVILYTRCKNKFVDIAEYLEALDCCFILGKITINEDGKLAYVTGIEL